MKLVDLAKDIVGKERTYEMQPEAICTLSALKKVSDVKGLEVKFKYVDVSANFGDDRHLLRHKNSTYGWIVEFYLPTGKDANPILNALLSIMGGQPRIEQGANQKVIVNPIGQVNLRGLTDYIGRYSGKGFTNPRIYGFRLERVPPSLYSKAIQAGLPLQEVQETKS